MIDFEKIKKGKSKIYFIFFIVLATISIQVYWNQLQYQSNKQLLINNIKDAFVLALESYNEKHLKELTNSDSSSDANVSVVEQSGFGDLDSDEPSAEEIDSIVSQLMKNLSIGLDKNKTDMVIHSFDMRKLYLQEIYEFIEQNLGANHSGLVFYIRQTVEDKEVGVFGRKDDVVYDFVERLSINPYAPNTFIELHYSNPVKQLLWMGLTGIILSLVLCSVVVYALYHLSNVIGRQKNLNDIKNDFISNISHEFKTPIATVSSIVEALNNFNADNNPQKSTRYLKLADQELKKLDQLVDKVMETALLENSDLIITKKEGDVLALIKRMIDNYNTSKTPHISLSIKTRQFSYSFDPFHFENAIANIIDNARKYGGDEIKVEVFKEDENLKIKISDNGEGIPAKDAPYIFDKFFRVLHKKMHHVNGFGVGLYYTKRIIEMHGSTIILSGKNTFEIVL